MTDQPLNPPSPPSDQPIDSTDHRLSERDRAALYWAFGPTFDDVGHQTAVGGQQLRDRRWMLLPALHAINDESGWISPAAIDEVARRLGLGAAEVYSVATFYDLFSLTERPARHVRACIDLACRAADPRLAADLPDRVEASACLGLCEQAPAALVSDQGARVAVGSVTADRLSELEWGGDDTEIPVAAPIDAVPQAGQSDLVLLARFGEHPLDLETYIEDGGFQAAAAAWTMTSDDIIEAVSASGLIGRGGAGFPTGRKWAAVAGQAETERYLVCNADESEPGTFKDRTVMENDPFGLIESILIAARAIGAQRAFVYVRGEYGRAWSTLEAALRLLAADPRTAPYFDDHQIALFRGAGAYICGEETAIFSSIEGYRGEPRSKPPFPFEVGLFGKPTAVNNVETLINLLPIINGAAAGQVWQAHRRLFCVSGAVDRPGVYEIQLGTRLDELIDLAGGPSGDSRVQAVLLGGAAGGFVSPTELGLQLDHQAVREAGQTLGSGVVMVFDNRVDLRDQVLRIAEFFRHESCGQCTPCRVGTVRQHEALERLASGDSDADVETALLEEINQVMTDASICGLGETAGNAVSVAINKLGVFDDSK